MVYLKNNTTIVFKSNYENFIKETGWNSNPERVKNNTVRKISDSEMNELGLFWDDWYQWLFVSIPEHKLPITSDGDNTILEVINEESGEPVDNFRHSEFDADVLPLRPEGYDFDYASTRDHESPNPTKYPITDIQLVCNDTVHGIPYYNRSDVLSISDITKWDELYIFTFWRNDPGL
ncbi:hypothetical protein Metev_0637 [Methanohalobium evestigatum Z-7303]|uniref:Uncharacterized protein n=1 Tax=Methanohalobium evestigatum (strain ATCC BAA-1072 / DSM 3721 / NBRC 107634 / OCM 161 / Z-7303) TaxID=644295 RepID=D7E8K1_METEZ|nr:hypothetical protein [Methanohalobium evestigatum]ADI73543.1 hypothetical protein Metev_0637 [Methanohalobium evestigatum Z-7303]